MIRKIISSFILNLLITVVSAQANKLPLKEWNSVTDKPFVFYISGDGGYTSFSDSLCGTINKAGYKVIALNSNSYFSDKKTTQQTTKDIVDCLNMQFSKRKNQQFVLAGYSFGADIAPFVVNALPDSVRKKMVSVVLLSPSTSTDFEIHFWDMLGWKKKRSMDVVAEINKMGIQKTAIISGTDENDLPVNTSKLKNFSNEKLPGGHRYEGNTNEVARAMMKYF
ncbi:MAG TPA: AcvB/VirJ family lysyl-phosphatidylglycerol hydrolase [Chitinophagaceae bacterium]|nr:AcvB/VirJ family lysyl-phosphatidylglycerol hydrolase [Chitinophagaceae bacterium]